MLLYENSEIAPSEGPTSLILRFGYFIETSPGVFEPTTDAQAATHSLNEYQPGMIRMDAIADAYNPLTVAEKGDIYFIY